MPSGFDYSKWDKIELSDDEDDLHPNIDKDSWFRLKHRTRVEREEDEGKSRGDLEKKMKKLQGELAAFGESGKEHMKAKKLQSEINEIEATLAKMDKERKWNADNMCKTTENRTEVSSSADREEPKPEPRLAGEAIADGYCEFLKEHGGKLLVGEHAESYLLLDCLEKEMNGEHAAMKRSARQCQLLTQLREFSRAAGRPARDAVHPVFKKLLDHEPTVESFNDTVQTFIKRIVKRAPEKKKEMDAEREAEGEEPLNPLGPGGLDPIEVLHTLPKEMQEAFKAQDIQRLQRVIESLPEEEAKHHLRRCEDSGLWVANPEAGRQPYRD